MRKWVEAAGLNPSEYIPHCLRRGGLTWAHEAKVSGEALHILGDWHSEAYLHYIDLDFDSRVETGRQMAECVSRKYAWCTKN